VRFPFTQGQSNPSGEPLGKLLPLPANIVIA
jgi:hypothetical protein